MGKTTNILDLNNRLTKVEQENVAQNSYTSLKNKPKINNVTLTGNKTLADIGAASVADLITPSANYSLLGSAPIDGSNPVTVSLGDNNIDDYDFLWIGNAYYNTGIATYGCVLVPAICMNYIYGGDAGVAIMSRDDTNTGVTPIKAVYSAANNNIVFDPEGTPAGQYYFVYGVKIRTNS